MLLPLFSILVILVSQAAGSELSRCCGGGTRHFIQTQTCSNIKAEGTSMTCVRSASICCLRSLLDAACEDGTQMAKQDEACAANINVLAGGIRKECCDCCLLAKDLLRRNEPCIAPQGFSVACLRSFTKCCMGDFEFTQSANAPLITDRPMGDGSVLHYGDRCVHSKCDHLCNDRGGSDVECSCRAGFELGSDGTACVDKNECAMQHGPCQRGREKCVNTIGGYICQPLTPKAASQRLRPHPVLSGRITGANGTIKETRRFIRMRDEPRSRWTPVTVNATAVGGIKTPRALKGPCNTGYQYMNGKCAEMFPGGFSCVCQSGFYYSTMAEECLDVDECMLLLDDCLESQRCLNTPGSFKCIRTLSCGTGYALDSDTEACHDVDECNLGAHDCGPLYQCRNTQGSYRCDPKKCGEGEVQNPTTGECTSIECPVGYQPKNEMCNDIDECVSGVARCGPAEQCINTPGSFRCQDLENMCAEGYSTNKQTGFCEDIDECLTRPCGNQQCINLPGSFKCRCSAGYEFDERTKRCEDIDECAKFAGHVCDLSATCQNTIGSFVCKCKAGFKLTPDGRRCEDINECDMGIARCEQKCVNIPGSYQCICDRGYTLGQDGLKCVDIDECAIWSGTGSDLCMGGCVNTKGSYLCQCPPGYKIQNDGRTCVDIDECELGECKGADRMCVNTLGHYKCHRIECPQNYIHDHTYKNRCSRDKSACSGLSDTACRANFPVHYSYQYIAIPRAVPISSHRPSITLFTIKGPSSKDASVQFELQLRNTVAESTTVNPAIRANFLLQKGKDKNSAVIALRDSLDGPQTVELDLTLRMSKNDVFAAKYVARLIVHVRVQDGYSCLKNCGKEDAGCIANNTREILYQFRAIPTLEFVKDPIEVSRIKTHMGIPFSVDYALDHVGNRHFMIEQDRNIGIVKLVRPVEGPAIETIRVMINTKSRTGVILAFNIAVIEVHVSRYSF